MKFIINRGLPGSGKSTLTKMEVASSYNDVVRVNRDDIRKMLHDSVWKGQETESVVVIMRDAMIRAAMKAKKPLVISDDTNLDPKVVKHLAKIAYFFGYEVEVRDFDLPLRVCLERDSKREGTEKVGHEVIYGMHKKYFKGGKFPENPLKNQIEAVRFEPYVADLSLPKAVIFDIDGTLASHEGVRSPYDYTKVGLDNPRQAVINALANYDRQGYVVIILSGREDSCRPDTIEWLYTNTSLGSLKEAWGSWNLFMRSAGDKRQDRVIKGELFDKHIRNSFNVEAVFDDRDQVVALWRDELGLDCFQVNYGAF